MSKVLIKNSSLNGTLALPPSKSAAHRALICSFLAGGGAVSPIINSNDMKNAIKEIKNYILGNPSLELHLKGYPLHILT